MQWRRSLLFQGCIDKKIQVKVQFTSLTKTHFNHCKEQSTEIKYCVNPILSLSAWQKLIFIIGVCIPSPPNHHHKDLNSIQAKHNTIKTISTFNLLVLSMILLDIILDMQLSSTNMMEFLKTIQPRGETDQEYNKHPAVIMSHNRKCISGPSCYFCCIFNYFHFSLLNTGCSAGTDKKYELITRVKKASWNLRHVANFP